MPQYTTGSYGFFYYDQYDINWHVGLNNNWINLDQILQTVETDIRGIGGFNFLPHTLFTLDSAANGTPELWEVFDGSITTSKSLQASQVMGFAYKYTATLDNSGGGGVAYDGLKIASLIPPNPNLTFSAYVKCSGQVRLRIKNGASYIYGSYETPTETTRMELPGTLDTDTADTELAIIVQVPAGQVVTLEVELPMLNVGDKASEFIPHVGEMEEFTVINNARIVGPLKADMDFNQRKAKQLRLETRSSDPGTPVEGQIWYNTDRDRPRFYDGSSSHDLSAAKQTFRWEVSGALSTGTENGGIWVVPRALTVEAVYIYCKTPGSAGSTIADLNQNGTSLWNTTPANRPELQHDDGDGLNTAGAADITGLSAGDILTLDIDQIATGAADLSVVLVCY